MSVDTITVTIERLKNGDRRFVVTQQQGDDEPQERMLAIQRVMLGGGNHVDGEVASFVSRLISEYPRAW